MKNQTKKTGQITDTAVESVNAAIDLSQQTAGVMIESAVKTAEMTTGYYRDAVNVGLSAQEAGLNIVRNYFDAMMKINQGWINLFSETGAKAVESVGEGIRQPVTDFITSGADIVENASAQAKQAAK